MSKALSSAIAMRASSPGARSATAATTTTTTTTHRRSHPASPDGVTFDDDSDNGNVDGSDSYDGQAGTRHLADYNLLPFPQPANTNNVSCSSLPATTTATTTTISPLVLDPRTAPDEVFTAWLAAVVSTIPPPTASTEAIRLGGSGGGVGVTLSQQARRRFGQREAQLRSAGAMLSRAVDILLRHQKELQSRRRTLHSYFASVEVKHRQQQQQEEQQEEEAEAEVRRSHRLASNNKGGGGGGGGEYNHRVRAEKQRDTASKYTIGEAKTGRRLDTVFFVLSRLEELEGIESVHGASTASGGGGANIANAAGNRSGDGSNNDDNDTDALARNLARRRLILGFPTTIADDERAAAAREEGESSPTPTNASSKNTGGGGGGGADSKGGSGAADGARPLSAGTGALYTGSLLGMASDDDADAKEGAEDDDDDATVVGLTTAAATRRERARRERNRQRLLAVMARQVRQLEQQLVLPLAPAKIQSRLRNELILSFSARILSMCGTAGASVNNSSGGGGDWNPNDSNSSTTTTTNRSSCSSSGVVAGSAESLAAFTLRQVHRYSHHHQPHAHGSQEKNNSYGNSGVAFTALDLATAAAAAAESTTTTTTGTPITPPCASTAAADDQIEAFVSWYVNEIIDPFCLSQLLELVPREYLVTTSCRLVYACERAAVLALYGSNNTINTSTSSSGASAGSGAPHRHPPPQQQDQQQQLSRALPDLGHVVIRAIVEGRMDAFALFASAEASVSFRSTAARTLPWLQVFYAPLITGQLDIVRRLCGSGGGGSGGGLGFHHPQALHVLLFTQLNWAADDYCREYQVRLVRWIQGRLERILRQARRNHLRRGSSDNNTSTNTNNNASKKLKEPEREYTDEELEVMQGMLALFHEDAAAQARRGPSHQHHHNHSHSHSHSHHSQHHHNVGGDDARLQLSSSPSLSLGSLQRIRLLLQSRRLCVEDREAQQRAENAEILATLSAALEPAMATNTTTIINNTNTNMGDVMSPSAMEASRALRSVMSFHGIDAAFPPTAHGGSNSNTNPSSSTTATPGGPHGYRGFNPSSSATATPHANTSTSSSNRHQKEGDTATANGNNSIDGKGFDHPDGLGDATFARLLETKSLDALVARQAATAMVLGYSTPELRRLNACSYTPLLPTVARSTTVVAVAGAGAGAAASNANANANNSTVGSGGGASNKNSSATSSAATSPRLTKRLTPGLPRAFAGGSSSSSSNGGGGGGGNNTTVSVTAVVTASATAVPLVMRADTCIDPAAPLIADTQHRQPNQLSSHGAVDRPGCVFSDTTFQEEIDEREAHHHAGNNNSSGGGGTVLPPHHRPPAAASQTIGATAPATAAQQSLLADAAARSASRLRRADEVARLAVARSVYYEAHVSLECLMLMSQLDAAAAASALREYCDGEEGAATASEAASAATTPMASTTMTMTAVAARPSWEIEAMYIRNSSTITGGGGGHTYSYNSINANNNLTTAPMTTAANPRTSLVTVRDFNSSVRNSYGSAAAAHAHHSHIINNSINAATSYTGHRSEAEAAVVASVSNGANRFIIGWCFGGKADEQKAAAVGGGGGGSGGAPHRAVFGVSFGLVRRRLLGRDRPSSCDDSPLDGPHRSNNNIDEWEEEEDGESRREELIFSVVCHRSNGDVAPLRLSELDPALRPQSTTATATATAASTRPSLADPVFIRVVRGGSSSSSRVPGLTAVASGFDTDNNKQKNRSDGDAVPRHGIGAASPFFIPNAKRPTSAGVVGITANDASTSLSHKSISATLRGCDGLAADGRSDATSTRPDDNDERNDATVFAHTSTSSSMSDYVESSSSGEEEEAVDDDDGEDRHRLSESRQHAAAMVTVYPRVTLVTSLNGGGTHHHGSGSISGGDSNNDDIIARLDYVSRGGGGGGGGAAAVGYGTGKGTHSSSSSALYGADGLALGFLYDPAGDSLALSINGTKLGVVFRGVTSSLSSSARTVSINNHNGGSIVSRDGASSAAAAGQKPFFPAAAIDVTRDVVDCLHAGSRPAAYHLSPLPTLTEATTTEGVPPVNRNAEEWSGSPPRRSTGGHIGWGRRGRELIVREMDSTSRDVCVVRFAFEGCNMLFMDTLHTPAIATAGGASVSHHARPCVPRLLDRRGKMQQVLSVLAPSCGGGGGGGGTGATATTAMGGGAAPSSSGASSNNISSSSRITNTTKSSNTSSGTSANNVTLLRVQLMLNTPSRGGLQDLFFFPPVYIRRRSDDALRDFFSSSSTATSTSSTSPTTGGGGGGRPGSSGGGGAKGSGSSGGGGGASSANRGIAIVAEGARLTALGAALAARSPDAALFIAAHPLTNFHDLSVDAVGHRRTALLAAAALGYSAVLQVLLERVPVEEVLELFAIRVQHDALVRIRREHLRRNLAALASYTTSTTTAATTPKNATATAAVGVGSSAAEAPPYALNLAASPAYHTPSATTTTTTTEDDVSSPITSATVSMLSGNCLYSTRRSDYTPLHCALLACTSEDQARLDAATVGARMTRTDNNADGHDDDDDDDELARVLAGGYASAAATCKERCVTVLLNFLCRVLAPCDRAMRRRLMEERRRQAKFGTMVIEDDEDDHNANTNNESEQLSDRVSDNGNSKETTTAKESTAAAKLSPAKTGQQQQQQQPAKANGSSSSLLLRAALNVLTRAGESALLIAVRHSNEPIALRLLRLGANPVCMDRVSRAYSLEIACANDSALLARTLLRQSAYQTSAVLVNHAGVAPPLCWCALNNMADMIPRLLRLGADPRVGHEDSPPLLLAVAFGSEEAAMALLAERRLAMENNINSNAMLIDVNAVGNTTRSSALHLACELGQVRVVRALLAMGARLDAACRPSCHTPLHTALISGQEAVAMALLEFGKDQLRASMAGGNNSNGKSNSNSHGSNTLDIAAIDADGDTALHLAARNGMTQVVEYTLEQYGAEEVARIQTARRTSNTAKAASSPPAGAYATTTIAATTDSGGGGGSSISSAPYKVMNKSGKTPLMLAIQANAIEAALVLISIAGGEEEEEQGGGVGGGGSDSNSGPSGLTVGCGGPVIEGTCMALLQAANNGLDEAVLAMLAMPAAFPSHPSFTGAFMDHYNDHRDRLDLADGDGDENEDEGDGNPLARQRRHSVSTDGGVAESAAAATGLTPSNQNQRNAHYIAIRGGRTRRALREREQERRRRLAGDGAGDGASTFSTDAVPSIPTTTTTTTVAISVSIAAAGGVTNSLAARARAQSRQNGGFSTASVGNHNGIAVSKRAAATSSPSSNSGSAHVRRRRSSYVRLLLAQGMSDTDPLDALRLLLRAFVLPELFTMLEVVAAESAILGIQSHDAMVYGELMVGFLQEHCDVAIAPTRVVAFCKEVLARFRQWVFPGGSDVVAAAAAGVNNSSATTAAAATLAGHRHEPEWHRRRAQTAAGMRRAPPLCQEVLRAIRLYGRSEDGQRAREEIDVSVATHCARETAAIERHRIKLEMTRGGGGGGGGEVDDDNTTTPSSLTEAHFTSQFGYSALQLCAVLGLGSVANHLIHRYGLSPLHSPWQAAVMTATATTTPVHLRQRTIAATGDWAENSGLHSTTTISVAVPPHGGASSSNNVRSVPPPSTVSSSSSSSSVSTTATTTTSAAAASPAFLVSPVESSSTGSVVAVLTDSDGGTDAKWLWTPFRLAVRALSECNVLACIGAPAASSTAATTATALVQQRLDVDYKEPVAVDPTQRTALQEILAGCIDATGGRTRASKQRRKSGPSPSGGGRADTFVGGGGRTSAASAQRVGLLLLRGGAAISGRFDARGMDAWLLAVSADGRAGQMACRLLSSEHHRRNSIIRAGGVGGSHHKNESPTPVVAEKAEFLPDMEDLHGRFIRLERQWAGHGYGISECAANHHNHGMDGGGLSEGAGDGNATPTTPRARGFASFSPHGGRGPNNSGGDRISHSHSHSSGGGGGGAVFVETSQVFETPASGLFGAAGRFGDDCDEEGSPLGATSTTARTGSLSLLDGSSSSTLVGEKSTAAPAALASAARAHCEQQQQQQQRRRHRKAGESRLLSRYLAFMLFACAEHNPGQLPSLLGTVLAPLMEQQQQQRQRTSSTNDSTDKNKVSASSSRPAALLPLLLSLLLAVHPITGDTLITFLLKRAQSRSVMLGTGMTEKKVHEMASRLLVGASRSNLFASGAFSSSPVRGGVAGNASTWDQQQQQTATAVAGAVGRDSNHQKQQEQQQQQQQSVDRDPLSIPAVRGLVEVAVELATMLAANMAALGRAEMVDNLLYHRARDGETALSMAARIGCMPLIGFLISPPDFSAGVSRPTTAVAHDGNKKKCRGNSGGGGGGMSGDKTSPLRQRQLHQLSDDEDELENDNIAWALSNDIHWGKPREQLITDNLSSVVVRTFLATRVYYSEEYTHVLYTLLTCIPDDLERIDFLMWVYPNIHPIPALQLASENARAARLFLSPSPAATNAFWVNVLYAQFIARLDDVSFSSSTWSVLLRTMLPEAPAVAVYLLKRGSMEMVESQAVQRRREEELRRSRRAVQRTLRLQQRSPQKQQQQGSNKSMNATRNVSPSASASFAATTTVGGGGSLMDADFNIGGGGGSSSKGRGGGSAAAAAAAAYVPRSNWEYISRRTDIFLRLMGLAVAHSLMPSRGGGGGASAINSNNDSSGQPATSLAFCPGIAHTLLEDVLELAIRFDDVDMFADLVKLQLPDNVMAALARSGGGLTSLTSTATTAPPTTAAAVASSSCHVAAGVIARAAELSLGSIRACCPTLTAATTAAQAAVCLSKLQDALWRNLVEGMRIDILAVAAGSITILATLFNNSNSGGAGGGGGGSLGSRAPPQPSSSSSSPNPMIVFGGSGLELSSSALLSLLRYDRIDARGGLPEGMVPSAPLLLTPAAASAETTDKLQLATSVSLRSSGRRGKSPALPIITIPKILAPPAAAAAIPAAAAIRTPSSSSSSSRSNSSLVGSNSSRDRSSRPFSVSITISSRSDTRTTLAAEEEEEGVEGDGDSGNAGNKQHSSGGAGVTPPRPRFSTQAGFTNGGCGSGGGSRGRSGVRAAAAAARAAAADEEEDASFARIIVADGCGVSSSAPQSAAAAAGAGGNSSGGVHHGNEQAQGAVTRKRGTLVPVLWGLGAATRMISAGGGGSGGGGGREAADAGHRMSNIRFVEGGGGMRGAAPTTPSPLSTVVVAVGKPPAAVMLGKKMPSPPQQKKDGRRLPVVPPSPSPPQQQQQQPRSPPREQPSWFVYLLGDWALHTTAVQLSPRPAAATLDVLLFLLDRRAPLSVGALQLFLSASQPSRAIYHSPSPLLSPPGSASGGAISHPSTGANSNSNMDTDTPQPLTLSFHTAAHADTLLHLLAINDQCQLAEYYLSFCLYYFSQLGHDEPGTRPGMFGVREEEEREGEDTVEGETAGAAAGRGWGDADVEFAGRDTATRTNSNSNSGGKPVRFLRLMLRRNRHGLTAFDYAHSPGMIQLLLLWGCVPPTYRANPRTFSRALGLSMSPSPTALALFANSSNCNRSSLIASLYPFFPVPRIILASENFAALQDGDNADRIYAAVGAATEQQQQQQQLERVSGTNSIARRRHLREQLALFNIVSAYGGSAGTAAAASSKGGKGGLAALSSRQQQQPPQVTDAVLLRNLLISQRAAVNTILPILLNDDVSLLHLGLCAADDELVLTYGNGGSRRNNSSVNGNNMGTADDDDDDDDDPSGSMPPAAGLPLIRGGGGGGGGGGAAMGGGAAARAIDAILNADRSPNHHHNSSSNSPSHVATGADDGDDTDAETGTDPSSRRHAHLSSYAASLLPPIATPGQQQQQMENHKASSPSPHRLPRVSSAVLAIKQQKQQQQQKRKTVAAAVTVAAVQPINQREIMAMLERRMFVVFPLSLPPPPVPAAAAAAAATAAAVQVSSRSSSASPKLKRSNSSIDNKASRTSSSDPHHHHRSSLSLPTDSAGIFLQKVMTAHHMDAEEVVEESANPNEAALLVALTPMQLAIAAGAMRGAVVATTNGRGGGTNSSATATSTAAAAAASSSPATAALQQFRSQWVFLSSPSMPSGGGSRLGSGGRRPGSSSFGGDGTSTANSSTRSSVVSGRGAGAAAALQPPPRPPVVVTAPVLQPVAFTMGDAAIAAGGAPAMADRLDDWAAEHLVKLAKAAAAAANASASTTKHNDSNASGRMATPTTTATSARTSSITRGRLSGAAAATATDGEAGEDEPHYLDSVRPTGGVATAEQQNLMRLLLRQFSSAAGGGGGGDKSATKSGAVARLSKEMGLRVEANYDIISRSITSGNYSSGGGVSSSVGHRATAKSNTNTKSSIDAPSSTATARTVGGFTAATAAPVPAVAVGGGGGDAMAAVRQLKSGPGGAKYASTL